MARHDADAHRFLTDSGLSSRALTEIMTTVTNHNDLSKILTNLENCQWTLYDVRRKYQGDSKGPFTNDGKPDGKPKFLGESDKTKDNDEDSDTESCKH